MEPFLNILIVEDNPGDVIIVSELIRSSGIEFRSVHASTLKDTIRLCGDNDFDIILLDLGLPDSMGLNTLKQLHASNDRSPIVVMTGLDDEETALRALREGALDYLVKNNITAEGIIRTIKYSIERKKIYDLNQRNTRRFSILSAATGALNECEDIPSIFRILCANIRTLLDNALVFAIEFPEEGMVRISGIEWLKPWFATIRQLTGHDLNYSLFRVNQEEEKILKIFDNRKLKEINGGLYSAFEGAIDQKSSAEIEKLLEIKFIYSIGFHQNKVFYGGFMIFPDHKVDDDDRLIIEAISNHTSINIHRRTIEKDLRYSEERYRKLSMELEQMVKLRTADLELLNEQLQKELNERITAEEALRISEVRLRELIATKDKFFNIVAHDLKNPFTSLLGSSELLFENIAQLDQENIKKLAIILNDSAKSGYAILLNLLDWSRSQTGMLKMIPETLNLRSIIEENILNLELFASNKEITVKSEVAGDILIHTDKNMINTILRNLISNALKFSFRKGIVLITARRSDHGISVSVKDFGMGISRENMDKLFRIDAKYSMPGTENEQGTGLGLKLCKEFVEKLDGRLQVVSDENKGSEFIFSIPAGKI